MLSEVFHFFYTWLFTLSDGTLSLPEYLLGMRNELAGLFSIAVTVAVVVFSFWLVTCVLKLIFYMFDR